MKEGYYLIGEVSKITGISKDTLHFYNKIGLLVPDYIDEKNQYRYYSRWNLWQLDIITTCRKLSVPLDKVKQILDFHDNGRITQLLLDYRNEALRLSRYYQQVAEDILWYDEENQRVSAAIHSEEVQKKRLKEEIVIAGTMTRDGTSYHANLQAAARDELRYSDTIQRKYGYILDIEEMRAGNIYKCSEYLKIADSSYSHVSPENLHVMPSGEYAVCIVRIIQESADFGPLFSWMKENGYTTDAVYADELALLIQSVYNIVDSYFVAKYSAEGLTALSIIFPIQLLMTAVATGTGTGINILVSRMDGAEASGAQNDMIKSGLFLGIVNFAVFTAVGLLGLDVYCRFSSDQPLVRAGGMQYGTIVFLFSLGMFVEANCTKILQARGNMVLPMCAQIFGALINIVLDPLLIFGKFGFPVMGIRGAAIATVIGQWSAMAVVLLSVLRHCPLNGRFRAGSCIQIYKAGMPAIVMQSLYTLYMVGLNLILKQFTEDAVTVLGIYYKLQTFFFIPLMGLQQVILPVMSFNYGAGDFKRVKETLKCSIAVSVTVMVLACGIFLAVPAELVTVFSGKKEILEIGCTALRIISVSFIPAAFVIMLTVYFQGVNMGRASISVTVLRQILLLVPLAWVFHFQGLSYVWLTFPVTEMIALLFCARLYVKYPPEHIWDRKDTYNCKADAVSGF